MKGKLLRSILTHIFAYYTVTNAFIWHFCLQLMKDRDEFFSPNHFGLHPSLLKSFSRVPSGVLEWEFLSARSIHSSWSSNPKRGHEEDLRIGLDDIIQQVLHVFLPCEALICHTYRYLSFSCHLMRGAIIFMLFKVQGSGFL
jgi:Chondroitin N-acetylgalactosaminyltransferase